jgi:hypothetical protein
VVKGGLLLFVAVIESAATVLFVSTSQAVVGGA